MPDLTLFLPELVLLVGGIVVLVIDALLRDRGKGEARLGWVSMAILAAALVVAILQWGTNFALFRETPALTSPGMYAVDGFTSFFRITSILTTGLIILMSMDFIRHRTAFRGEFFALMLFSTLAMILMAGSTDMVMVILALEFLSITSYILTGYLRGNAKSNEGAVKYFLFGSVTTAITFFGASLLFGLTGTTNLYTMADALVNPATLESGNGLSLILPAIVFLIAGFGFKIALVPFHQWSPDAYEGAPVPVTAFLSVGPKAAGLAMLLRVMVVGMPEFIPSWAALALGIAIVTMTVGNLIALSQSNVKRLMAYSSIAQAGYMAIGVAAISLVNIARAGGAVDPAQATGSALAQTASLGSSIDGTAGVLIYILAYLFTNLGLFTGIIAVDHLTGAEHIEGYAGLIKRAPFLTVAMTIFFLSLVGIPPTAGFIGKFWVFGAALSQGLLFLALVGAVNGVISVVYYFMLLKQMWLAPPLDATPIRLPRTMMASLVVCLVMVLVIGLYPAPFIEFANQSIQMFGVGPGLPQAVR